MRDFLKKTFGWLKESNRPLHAYAGFAALVIMLIVQASMMSFVDGACTIPETLGDRIMILFTITALFVVFMLMCTVEFIQFRSLHGLWDWLDISAGMLPAVVTAIFVILVILLT